MEIASTDCTVVDTEVFSDRRKSNDVYLLPLFFWRTTTTDPVAAHRSSNCIRNKGWICSCTFVCILWRYRRRMYTEVRDRFGRRYNYRECFLVWNALMIKNMSICRRGVKNLLANYRVEWLCQFFAEIKYFPVSLFIGMSEYTGIAVEKDLPYAGYFFSVFGNEFARLRGANR